LHLIMTFQFSTSPQPQTRPPLPTRRSSDLAFSNNTASLFVENEAAAGGRQVIAEGKLASGPQQLFFLVPVPPESKLIYRIIALKDRKSTRLNSSHVKISYAVFCLKKTKQIL